MPNEFDYGDDTDLLEPPDDAQPMPVAPVVPPAPAPAPAPVPAAAPPRPAGPSAFDVQMQDLRRQYAQMPVAQANAAVSAALQYEGLRGYENDLQAGKTPAEALSKWAPIMFTAPRTATLSGAASMVRASSAPRMRQMNVGGVLYNVEPTTGRATPITPPKVVAPRPNALVINQHRNLLAQAQAIEKELDIESSGPDADANRQKLQYIRGQISNLEKQFASPAAAAPRAPIMAPGTAADVPAAGRKEVIRRTKGGKRAVFDAETRQFLRYAE